MKLRIFFVICILPFLLFAEPKESVMPKNDLKWFEFKNCQTLEIQDFAKIVDEKPKKSKVISDPKAISEIMELIEKIPTNGPELKSFSDEVPVVYLIFQCDKMKQGVEFYRGRIKTPATGFLDHKNDDEIKAFEWVQKQFKSQSKN